MTLRRGRATYIKKREEYYRAHANVVEVDLLRIGAELIDVPFEEVPDRLLTPYKAVVRRSSPKDKTEAEYYAFPMREMLPRIAIPLRRKDSDVVLNIQPAIDEAYKKGRFATRLDYPKPPKPRLDPDDAAWAAKLVAASVLFDMHQKRRDRRCGLASIRKRHNRFALAYAANSSDEPTTTESIFSL